MDKIEAFVREIELKTLNAGIDVSSFEMDHICYRVESEKDYVIWKEKLTKMGLLLVEDEINGRLISTFELIDPIFVGSRSIRMIELPMPKPSVYYPTGWEHAEFVVGKEVDLEKFAKSYSNLTWDFSGIKKVLNADIRLELSVNPPMCIKFHQLPLDKVIEIEKLEK